MQMKLCVCKLDDTLSQNAKDGGCRSLHGFRGKICPKVYVVGIKCVGHILVTGLGLVLMN